MKVFVLNVLIFLIIQLHQFLLLPLPHVPENQWLINHQFKAQIGNLKDKIMHQIKSHLMESTVAFKNGHHYVTLTEISKSS